MPTDRGLVRGPDVHQKTGDVERWLIGRPYFLGSGA